MKVEIIIMLISISIIMLMINLYFLNSRINSYSTDNIKIDSNMIYLDSLTLKQKLSQMIIVSGRRNNERVTNFNIGGIYLFGSKSREYYENKIKAFNEDSRIKLFFSTDLEGYWNPFKRFYNSRTFSEIEDLDDAGKLGDDHGRILAEIGFNMNFAPIAEANGKVWDGRGFNGTSSDIANKSNAYISALQKHSIIGVVKHYPGGSIDTADPHKYVVERKIIDDDIFPFLMSFKNAKGVMVGHVVASGEIDSNGKPCSVSKECIDSIRNSGFNGLIITDEVNMKGLRNFYKSKEEIYIDLINSGNDIILDFSLTPRRLDKLLKQLEIDITSGKIDIEKVDESVTKILNAKGYILR